jgi:hypothetical protein
MRIGHIALTLLLLVVALAPVAACDLDPVHASLVSQLGPEAPNIPKGPYHRAGQPCIVCHGDDGPANVKFAVAGTVFYGPGTKTDSNGNAIPLIGAGSVNVYIEDSSGSMGSMLPPVTTNCVGNWWIKASDYTPSFPLLVTITGPTVGNGTATQTMRTQIGREPSCGMCHQVQSYPDQPGAISNYYQTPGVVYLTGDDPMYQGDPTTCGNGQSPVNPPFPQGLGPVSP